MSTRQQNTVSNHPVFKSGKAPKRFTPLFNDAFLKIFGSADSEPVTKPLLNAILRQVGIPEIERVDHITADAALPGGVECRTPRLDVVVLCDDGRLIDLEAQSHKVDIEKKSLFYAAKLMVENTPKSGSDKNYNDVPQTIVVVLLRGSELFPDEEQFVNVCKMRWNEDGLAKDGPDLITIVVAELDKVCERYNRGNIDEVLANESLAWLYLLAAGYKSPKEVESIMANFPTIEEFATRYGIAIDDPDLKRAYEKYWESELEWNSLLYQAHKDGFEEGREEGLAAGRQDAIETGRREGIARGREESIAMLRAAGFNEAADALEAQSKNEQ